MKISRKEIKYKVPNIISNEIKNNLIGILNSDQNANKSKYYNILSVYFDDLNFQFFLDKVEGQEFRIKPRLRYYFDENKNPTKCFLELKKKENSIVYKDKVELSIDDSIDFTNGNLKKIYKKYNTDKTFNEFMYLNKKFYLKPKVRIFYEREAFFSNIFKGFRITFDKNIKASFSSFANLNTFNNRQNVLNKSFHIVELKSNYEIPAPVISLFKKFNLQQIAYSKYVESINFCYKF